MKQLKYFSLLCKRFSLAELKQKRNLIKFRRNRPVISGFNKVYHFFSGDIIKVVAMCRNLPFVFEGVCISVRRRKFCSSNVSFILRNIIFGVILEVTFSYYYNRLYTMKLHDYKRKMYNVRGSKILFIRSRLNRESRVH